MPGKSFYQKYIDCINEGLAMGGEEVYFSIFVEQVDEGEEGHLSDEEIHTIQVNAYKRLQLTLEHLHNDDYEGGAKAIAEAELLEKGETQQDLMKEFKDIVTGDNSYAKRYKPGSFLIPEYLYNPYFSRKSLDKIFGKMESPPPSPGSVYFTHMISLPRERKRGLFKEISSATSSPTPPSPGSSLPSPSSSTDNTSSNLTEIRSRRLPSDNSDYEKRSIFSHPVNENKENQTRKKSRCCNLL